MSIPPHPAPLDSRDAIFDVSGIADGLTGKTGRSAITVLIFAALKIIVAFGTTAVLARLVPPEQQGIFALAIPAVLITAAMSEFGLPQAIVQRPHVTHQMASALIWIGGVVGLTSMAIVVALALPAARFFDIPEVATVFMLLSPYVLLSVLTAQYVALLRRQMRIRQIEVGALIAAILAAILAIAAAWSGAGYWALVVQLLMAEMFNLVYLLAITRWLPSSPLTCRFKEARNALSFGGYLAAERLMAEFTRNMQVVVVGRAFTSVDAGVFYRAQSVTLTPQKRILSPLSGAFLPSLSRLQDDAPAFRAMYVRQISRGNLIMVSISLVLISCADLLVQILLGPNWTAAAPVMAWLALVPLAALTINSFAWCLVACGRGREMFLGRIVISTALLAALLSSAQISLLALVQAYVLTLVMVQGSVFGVLALRYTPLNIATVREAVGGEIVFTAIALPAALALRATLDLSPALLEALAVAVLFAVLYGVRIAIDPGLRKDIRTALARVSGE